MEPTTVHCNDADRGKPSQLLTNLERGGYRLAYNDVPSAHEHATKYLGN
jgi:hypothetical protein